jgi:DNA/RNA-binding domain of Phe-tRNA-synthetase-like protein
MTLHFSVAPEVAQHVTAGLLVVDGVRVVEAHEALTAALARLASGLPDSDALVNAVSAVRAMYRRFGVDPTKTRPSSEALLRRLRKGDPFPRVNSAVDVCNWCSVETRLPFGLYDAGRIEGDVELRVGRDGEEYAGIRKDTVHVAGRLTVADARGPFGNPTSDSARTMVTPETTRLMYVVFSPHGLGARVLEHALALTAVRALEYCGGHEVLRAAYWPQCVSRLRPTAYRKTETETTRPFESLTPPDVRVPFVRQPAE